MLTLAFDVYGTLIDTAAIVSSLEKLAGDQAHSFSELWRAKQLEYSFRRGLMQNYQDFSVCTSTALDYCCAVYGMKLSRQERQALLESYQVLPAFPDVEQTLSNLRKSDCRIFAFSNGKPDDVITLLRQARIEKLLDGVISTDAIKSFKPNPAVYAYFLRQSAAVAAESWMVSGNPFDVIGAVSAGMKSVWVKRSEQAVFDPWEIQPTEIVTSLNELPDALQLTAPLT